MTSLHEPPLFAALKDAGRILVAGAGGGFDVYAGLPLAFALTGLGKSVHLANLSFSALDLIDADAWYEPNLAAITPATRGHDGYFPERTLARWLAAQSMDATVYAFPRTGVRPLRDAYRNLVRRLGIDAIVLVDGGTDILMRGDEAGVGTPEEDMTSLAAVAGVDVPVRLVACVGFGVDAYHGVCHAHVLENLAALDRDGAYLGALTIPSASREALLYVDAVAHAQRHTPMRPSIVNGQIAAAVRGEFGDVRFTDRTRGSELFVNPLMAMYFTVDLAGLARRLLYLDRLADTDTQYEVRAVIEWFRRGVRRRERRSIPH
ncbi:DUF1152 domain-containing protein [Actinoallomurus rhizosphaericola]|uniref:DUF1152 domain-containing protein n=1 Tax=Actinoallomurus rhizosphaericola TaxID=2952536 RepID=UPI002092E899|nr:DUF1152 domain-containing protein [Actinoallomurus rhizosphaericola]MCO5997647.1 DUF1152 domain-containing protein [Actinoallomurus rhizosphaericola]